MKIHRYIVVHEKCCLEHNHEIRLPSVVNGIRLVNHESELTAEESKYMTEILPLLRGASARRCLETHFPNREFSASLVQRAVKKGKIQLFGSDSDAINRFMEFGKSLSSNGGVFNCRFDGSMRIDEVMLQSHQWQNTPHLITILQLWTVHF